MRGDTISTLRNNLKNAGADALVLTTTDNIYYASGFSSVMDGWHLIEPIAALVVPADDSRPVTLFLPEASLISLVIAARDGHPIAFDRLRTYDMLNFCEVARAQDAHLDLPQDLIEELTAFAGRVDGDCAEDIIKAIDVCLQDMDLRRSTVLFDDLRVGHRLEIASGQSWADGLDLMLACRARKTPEELDTLRESGRIADRIMAHTVAELGVGARWTEVEKSVAKFMIDQGVDPLPGSPMLFGGAYDLVFRPDLFRTEYDRPFQQGDIAILETQGRYRGFWIDINRTAHMGEATPAYREQHAVVKEVFAKLTARLKPGANTAELCRTDNIAAMRKLSAPEKLLVVAHSVGHVPLESPVRYPGTGLHAATEGFVVEENMVISIDCLYFGSRHGPSHMENVFVVTAEGAESLYQYPLDLIEVA